MEKEAVQPLFFFMQLCGTSAENTQETADSPPQFYVAE